MCCFFLAITGKEAMDIFNVLHLNEEEEKKFIVTQAFDDFIIGETNESYDSYKFHTRRQKPDEPIEAFVTSRRQLIKSSNFGTAQLEDRLIRDQVVVGVREDYLCEHFLEDKKNSL